MGKFSIFATSAMSFVCQRRLMDVAVAGCGVGGDVEGFIVIVDLLSLLRFSSPKGWLKFHVCEDHTHTHTHTHTRTHTHARTHTYTHTRTHARTHTPHTLCKDHTHTHTAHAHTHTHTHTHTHARTHARTHAHTHTHTHKRI